MKWSMTFPKMPFDAAVQNRIMSWLNDRTAIMTEWHLLRLSYLTLMPKEGLEQECDRYRLKESVESERREMTCCVSHNRNPTARIKKTKSRASRRNQPRERKVRSSYHENYITLSKKKNAIKCSKKSLQNWVFKLIVHYSILIENSVSLKNEKIEGQNDSSCIIVQRDAENWKNFWKVITCISVFKNETRFCCWLVFKFAQLLSACEWLGHFTGMERICMCVCTCNVLSLQTNYVHHVHCCFLLLAYMMIIRYFFLPHFTL